MNAPLLQVNDLKKHFPIRGGLFSTITGYVFAVDGISFKKVIFNQACNCLKMVAI